ncbi:MAG: alpha/beta hydrolase [Prevotella sp.]|nr:alpha/beta hydrolase [Prevotella sp.]
MNSLNGIYQTNLPDGELLLVVPEEGDAYCVVCRYNKTDSIFESDSILVTFDAETVKDISGNTIAKLRLNNDSLYAMVTSSTGEEITSKLEHHDFVAPDKPIVTKHPIRYLEPITSDTAMVVSDILYSTASGFYSSNPVGDIPISEYDTYIDAMLDKYEFSTKDIDLHMDIYSIENDTVKQRPLIILLHGGAFLFGDKAGTFMRHLAQHFATRGYMVASLNYRMGCSFGGIVTIQRTIYRAVQDTDRAIRFLISHSDDFGFDPHSIFLVGHSAGAITALTASVMTDDESDDDVTSAPFRRDLGSLPPIVPPLGTIGLWGAITDLDLIDRADNPDFLLMHGTDDDIVPFREGIPFVKNMPGVLDLFLNRSNRLYGSGAIKEKMDQLGLPCQVHFFPGLNHDPHLNEEGKFNDNIHVVDSITTSFLYSKLDKLCNPIFGGNIANYIQRYDIFSDVDIREIAWHVRGGLLYKRVSDTEIDCYMFTNAPLSEVSAEVVLANGLTVKRVYRKNGNTINKY